MKWLFFLETAVFSNLMGNVRCLGPKSVFWVSIRHAMFYRMWSHIKHYLKFSIVMLHFCLWLGGALSCFWGCGQSNAKSDGGFGDFLNPSKDVLVISDGSGGTIIDFVVQGCRSLGEDSCIGEAPLTLTFLAIVPKKTENLVWTFGDGSPQKSGLVVTHTYEKPGSYDVTLSMGEKDGTVSEKKPAFIFAQKAVAGASCEADDICRSGKCVCRFSCTFPLNEGLCLEECAEGICSSEKLACINLKSSSIIESEPWRTQLCLPTCTVDTDCSRPHFFCRDAPGVSSWQKVCMPLFPRSIGEACRNNYGTVDNLLCLGGLCLDFGASGYCSQKCKAGTCPSGTSCVKFSGLDDPVCLEQCVKGSCENDPMLACMAPEGAGEYGFTVLDKNLPQGTTFCSVKSCKDASECGASGYCDLQTGGYCLPK